jgi:hypothetical protein
MTAAEEHSGPSRFGFGVGKADDSIASISMSTPRLADFSPMVWAYVPVDPRPAGLDFITEVRRQRDRL